MVGYVPVGKQELNPMSAVELERFHHPQSCTAPLAQVQARLLHADTAAYQYYASAPAVTCTQNTTKQNKCLKKYFFFKKGK